MKQTFNKEYSHTKSQNTSNLQRKTTTHGILRTKV
jgi:hypothetical protein